ncbi:hypothetical protein V2E24_02085 [Mycoplasmopsis ciconiae]|uniref:Uncharacterized protein n=2 Tax=Mycoplasmopsis ciconiae TaxID=561067 RepID=A0ABU7MLL1_9BACT|nr:hypothetical protein [Mycoplasmopsis ciconiae]
MLDIKDKIKELKNQTSNEHIQKELNIHIDKAEESQINDPILRTNIDAISSVPRSIREKELSKIEKKFLPYKKDKEARKIYKKRLALIFLAILGVLIILASIIVLLTYAVINVQ